MAELLDLLDAGDIDHLRLKAVDHTGHVENEGRLYYDIADHNLSFINDIAGSVLHIGEQMFLRVVNNSAGIIEKGAACRHNGVVGGRPQVELAIADTYTNASILGLADGDIAVGAEGFLVFMGPIKHWDTTLIPVGQPIYLSDTVPGGWTTTPPAIATQVGGNLVSDANGTFQVNIRRNINLPNSIGFLQGILVSPISVTTAVLGIVGYAASGGLVMGTDPTLGRISTVYAGTYRANFSFSGTTSVDRRTLFWELYDVTNDVVLYTFYHPFNKNLTLGQISVSFNFPFTLAAPAVLQMRVRGSASFDVGIDDINFDIESVRIAI